LPRPKPSAKADETTRDRVVRASLELFAEKGFNGTGIRDLAGAAGLTTSTLYHYMANKDDLLVEIMEGAITPLHRAARDILDEMADPVAALATIVEHHVWVHASDRLACIVTDTEVRALSGERLARVLELRDGYEGLWRRAVTAGVAAGGFQAPSPETAARALLQMATGVSHWFSPSGSLSLAQLCHLYADGALGFLRAGATRADLELPAPDHYLR
jgi:AcrR family transcriptional regulator